jgi:hypothetical protein
MTRPSWQDFGTFDESAHPQLWDGVVGAWCPSLGPTGAKFHDSSGRNNWGAANGMTLATDWQMQSGVYGIATSTASKYVQCEPVPIEGTSDFTVSLWVNVSATQTASDSLVPLFGQKAASATDAGFIVVYFYGGANTGKWMVSTGSGSASSEILTTTAANVTNTIAHVIMRRGAGLAQNGDFVINSVQYPLASTLTILNITTTSKMTWGRDASAFRQTNQVIFDATCWRRCLSLNEIAELYRIGIAGMYERKRRTLRRYMTEQATGARRRRILCGDYS